MCNFEKVRISKTYEGRLDLKVVKNEDFHRSNLRRFIITEHEFAKTLWKNQSLFRFLEDLVAICDLK